MSFNLDHSEGLAIIFEVINSLYCRQSKVPVPSTTSHFSFWYSRYSAFPNPGTREYSVISAVGTLGAGEFSVISAVDTPGTGKYAVSSAFGTQE